MVCKRLPRYTNHLLTPSLIIGNVLSDQMDIRSYAAAAHQTFNPNNNSYIYKTSPHNHNPTNPISKPSQIRIETSAQFLPAAAT